MQITFTLQPQYSGTLANNFNIFGTTSGNVTYQLASNISLSTLISGYVLNIEYENITGGTICSTGFCTNCEPWVLNVITPVVTQTPIVTETPIFTQTPIVTETPVITETPIVLTSTPLQFTQVFISNSEFISLNEACQAISADVSIYVIPGSTIDIGTTLYSNEQMTLLYLPNGSLDNYYLLIDDIGNRYSIKISVNSTIELIQVC